MNQLGETDLFSCLFWFQLGMAWFKKRMERDSKCCGHIESHVTTYTRTSIWEFDSFELVVPVACTHPSPVQCRDGDSQISLSSLWMRLS